jgi:hypothetical protein
MTTELYADVVTSGNAETAGGGSEMNVAVLAAIWPTESRTMYSMTRVKADAVPVKETVPN